MNATIYIQKKNEERWEGITDKSAWVNAMLEKSPPNSLVESQKLEKRAVVVSASDVPMTKDNPSQLTERVFEFCKHEQVKGMCKHGC